MRHYLVSFFCVPLFLCACGGDDSKSIVGELERQSSSSRSRSSAIGGPSYAIDVANVDQIWAMPVYGAALGTSSFEEKVIVPISADGSFEFVAPTGGDYDYVLALVDSTKCTTAKPRADWTEADIDNRLGCMQGYVAVGTSAGATNESGSDVMTAMPVSGLSGQVDVGNLVSNGLYAVSESTTLDEVTGSFSQSLDGLKALAKVDNMLTGLSYFYANRDDAFDQYYSQNLDYTWVAASALNSTKGQFTTGSGLEITPFTSYFGFNVDSAGALTGVQATAGYLEFTPPGNIDVQMIGQRGPDNPIATSAPGTVEGTGWTDGVVGFGIENNTVFGNFSPFTGTLPSGEWKISRDGAVVAKYDLSTSAPFEVVNGVVDDTAPLAFVPSVMVNIEGDAVTSVDVQYTVWDGSSFVLLSFDEAVRAVGHIGLGLAGDESSACPSNNHERTAGIDSNVEIMSDRLRWTPQRSWKFGPGDATHCGVSDVTAGYNVSQNSFQFHWSIDDQIR